MIPGAQLIFLCSFFVAVNGQSLTITSRPAALFGANMGMHSVVEGSVIQLYCSVQPSTATISWMFNGSQVVIDVPHLLVRTSSDGNSVLTVDNFGSGDNGMYHCQAVDGGVTQSGDTVTLTAVSSLGSGTLVIRQQPTDNQRTIFSGTTDLPILYDNRTAVSVGDTVDPTSTPDGDMLLRCVAGHQNDNVTDFNTPTVEWIKDGETVVEGTGIVINTTSVGSNGEVASVLQIASFTASDAGVYQCVFTDDIGSDGDTITTIPLRLDTGETLTISRVSPEAIVLRPPEKLVIEVEATGRYRYLDWSRNGNQFSTNMAHSFFVRLPGIDPTSSELTNYFEVFAREPTSSSDFGLYEVQSFPFSGTQPLEPAGGHVLIAVISEADAQNATITAVSGPTVSVPEGGSVDIICSSTGIPTPTITWNFNGTAAPFSQTDTVVGVKVNVMTSPTDPSTFTVDPGSIFSDLNIVAATYPDHNGMYTCVGVNSDDATFTSSSAFITVEVRVVPEVEVTSDSLMNRVNIGETITLTCSVIRGNPTTYTYKWIHLPSSTSPTETSNMLTLASISADDLGTYECEVTNDAGIGTATLTISEGVPPSVTAVQPPDPVVVDSNVDLVCIVTGDTPVTITWTHDSGGRVLVFSGNESSGGNFTLTVNSDDYESYTCTATNRFGMDNGTVTIIQAVGPTLSPDRSMEVTVGDTLVLSTTIALFNLPITDITWTRDGQVVTSDTDSITIFNQAFNPPNETSTLTLTPVNSPNDGAGTYIVTVTNPAGSDMTVFTVTVTDPVMITDPAMDTAVSVNETDDISLSCTARGFPAPSITWARGGVPLTGSEDRITISLPIQSTDNSTGYIFVTSILTVSGTTRPDANTYSCTANNTVEGQLEQAERMFTVDVNFAVTIYVGPQNTTVLSPDMVLLDCMADGVPTPTITWIKTVNSGSEIELSSSIETINIESTAVGLNKTSTLTIDPTDALDTAGYTCRAENNVFGAVDSDTAYVTVYVQPSISDPLEGAVFTVNETETTDTPCIASGVPAPTIEFMRDGMVLDRTGDMSTIGTSLSDRVQLQPATPPVLNSDGTYMVSRSLTIFNLEDSDSGSFVCNATSDGGMVDIPSDQVTFELLVQVAPNITTPPVDQTVLSPDAVMFTCAADGVPTPTVTWWRYNSTTLTQVTGSMVGVTLEDTPGGDMRSTTSMLTFDPSQPFLTAQYVCQASNLLGMASENVTLTVNDRPAIVTPPENLTVTVDELTNETFTCAASGIPAPNITWYRVVNSERFSLNGEERFVFGDLMQIDDYQLPDNRGEASLVTQTLTVIGLADGDSGTYGCTATSAVGSASRDVGLVVRVAPSFIVQPGDVMAMEPNTVTFLCQVTGRPRPIITWSFVPEDGSGASTPVVAMVGEVEITEMEMGDRNSSSNLTVIGVLPSNAGNYTCTAENEVAVGGVIASTAGLMVYVTPMVTSVYPGMGQMNYTVNETDSVTFECSATGIPPPTITWFRNGMELNMTTDSRVTVDDPAPMDFMRSDGESVSMVTRTLTLTNTEDGDSGTYTCRATNDAVPGSAMEDFELIVQVAPNVTRIEPLQQTVTEPNSATFTCSATARPRPTIQWYTNDGANRTLLVNGSGDVSVVEMFVGDREIVSTLTVSPTAPSDGASYVCVAENDVSRDEGSANLTVYVTPMITSVFPDVGQIDYTVNETDSVTFECSATGIPSPTITWFRNGMELNMTTDSRVTVDDPAPMDFMRSDGETVSMVNCTLTLTNTVDGDSGMYTCRATNDAVPGSATEDFALIVQVAPNVTRIEPLQQTVTEPDSATFTCSATARSRPTIQWYTNDGANRTLLVNGTGDVSVVEMFVGDREIVSTLTVSPTAPSDGASYVCVAENDVSRDEGSANLTVYVTPMITSVFPDVGQIDYTVNETDSVTFECSATGIPSPTITWFRNGMELNMTTDSRVTVNDPATLDFTRMNDGEIVSMVTRTLTLTNTVDGDSGTYTCRATNDAVPGSDVEEYELIVQVAPSIAALEPLPLTVTEPDSAMFTCNATARPRPTIQWYINNSTDLILLVDGTDNVEIAEQEFGNRGLTSSLTLSPTAPSDATLYQCVAENDVSTDELPTPLFVYVTPLVTSVYPGMGQMNYTVNEEDTATFECSATGIPSPTITWFRNGMELNMTTDSRVTVNDPATMDFARTSDGEIVSMVTRALTLTNTVDGDSGNYTCRATNDAAPGSAMEDFELIIQVAPNVTRIEPLQLTVTEPDSATFTCSAIARPRPTIQWYTNDGTSRTLLVNGTGDVSITETLIEDREIDSSLTVSPTAPSDATSYVCVAENDVTTDESTADLTVNVSPMISSVYPGEGQMNYTVNETESVTFECSATGIPPPTITWFRNGTELNMTTDSRVTVNDPATMDFARTSDGEIVSMVTRTLNIINTTGEDTGNYTCMVSNNAEPGSAMEDFELIVQVAPNVTMFMPTELAVTEPDSAQFSCTATGCPLPVVSWYRVNGAERTLLINGVDGISIFQQVFSTTVEGSVTLSQTAPSRTAEYECLAENVVDSAARRGNLSVYVTPVVTNVYPTGNQTSYTVNQGQTVLFECIATGVPAPTITWLRVGVELSDARITVNDPVVTTITRAFDGEMISMVTRTLELVNATDDDSGLYMCRGTNLADPNSNTMNFDHVVQIAPVLAPIAPPQQTITAPASALMACEARGRPRPTISWYRIELGGTARTRLEASDSNIMIEDTEDGDRRRTSALTILSTAPSDATDYACVAENDVSTVEMSTSLTVYVVPEIVFSAPVGGYVVNETFAVTFMCNATGIPPPIIQWYRDQTLLNGTMGSDFTGTDLNTRVVADDPVVQSTLGEVSSVWRSLTVMNAMGGDTGSYRCEATNAALCGMDSEEFDHFVQVPPTVVPLDDDQEIIANETESATLSFRIDRAAPPVPTEDIRWFYSGQFSETPDGMDVMDITNPNNRTSRSRLTFSPDLLSLSVEDIVQARMFGEETDQGRYFLQVTHPAGVGFSYIDLIVFGPPLITIEPSDQTAIKNGSNAVFTCTARAVPEHTVSWTFTSFDDGVEIDIISTSDAVDTSKYRISRNRTLASRFGELTVMDVQFLDRGTYNCTAENIIGAETRGADLTVQVTPVIERTYTPGDVTFPQPANLVCLVTGYPIPSVSWQKNGETIDLFGSMVDLQARIVIFDFIVTEIQNSTMDSRTIDSGYNQTVRSLITMTDISIDEVLALGELGIVSVLSIEGVVREDTATYTCTAINELPETTMLVAASDALPLTVLERPDPPVDVMAFRSGARWIALRWTPTFNGNRPVTSFNLYVRNVNETEDFTSLTQLESASLMMDGVRFMFNVSDQSVVLPFTQYSFRVVSCNEIGCSDRSEPSDVIRTDEDRPDAPPNITEAFSPSSRSLYLSWDPPPTELHRGVLIGYQITYTIVDNQDMSALVTTTTETSITLEELSIFATYRVSIAAGTVVGYGPEDSVVITIDSRLPPTPTLLTVNGVTSQRVTISWQLDTASVDVPVTSYIANVVAVDTNQVIFSDENLSPDVLMLALNDLQPTTAYRFSIRAVNDVTIGEAVSFEFRTIAGVIFFQLRLLLTGVGRSCNEWLAVDQSSLEQAANEVADEVVINVEDRCVGCGFTRSNIRLDGFRCFPGTTDAVTYRGELQETDSANVLELIRHVEEWTAPGNVLIRVQRVFIEIDRTCRVAIESISEEECLPRNTTTPISSTSGETEAPTQTAAASSIAIIGGAAGAAVLVLLLILTVAVVVMILVAKSRRDSYKLQGANTIRNYSYDDVRRNVPAIQRGRKENDEDYENMEMPVSHEYETLDQYNKEYETMDEVISNPQVIKEKPTTAGGGGGGAYDFTTCAAYVKTNQKSLATTEEVAAAEYELIHYPVSTHETSPLAAPDDQVASGTEPIDAGRDGGPEEEDAT